LIEITEEDFSLDEMVVRAKREDTGAIVTFLGSVRNDDINRMELEAFREVALAELELIRDEAMSQFSLKSVEVVHRIGHLNVGDNIVAVVCSAGHRNEAFLGCRYIIEELKKRAPIWKKEIRKNGERWVGNE
jgi:molybdopterin synthase catalytic subunit